MVLQWNQKFVEGCSLYNNTYVIRGKGLHFNPLLPDDALRHHPVNSG